MAFTAIMATLGATSNYLLASWLFKGIVTGLFPARVQGFSQEASRQWARQRQLCYCSCCCNFCSGARADMMMVCMTIG